MAMTTQNLGKVGLVDKQTYDSSVEYSRLDFVTDENNISTYISLVDNNIGNPLSDQTKWRFLAKGKANTPQEALELILQADGHGSGLDADKLDGTELVDIVNPEEVTSASPFDFFLGAKEVEQGDGTKKWVFQKMSPRTMAKVAAGLMPGLVDTGELEGANIDAIKTTCGNYIYWGGTVPSGTFPITMNNGVSLLLFVRSIAGMSVQTLYTGAVGMGTITHKYERIFTDRWSPWTDMGAITAKS